MKGIARMSQKIYNRIPTKIYKISGFIYELLPFLYIISGFLLLSGIHSISHIAIGIIQFIVGIFILFMRFDCRMRKWHKKE